MDLDHLKPKRIIFEPLLVNYEFFQNLTQHHTQYLTPSHTLMYEILHLLWKF